MRKDRRSRSRRPSSGPPLNGAQRPAKPGEADIGARGVVDHDSRAGDRAEYSECHREPVITVGADPAARRCVAPLNEEVVPARLGDGADGPEILRNERKTIALLDPQLAHL